LPISRLAPAFALLAALPLMVGFWFLVIGILASVSGWSALAEAFPAGPRPPGTVLRGQVLGLGRVRENNVTNLIETPEGLYLFPMALFSFRRPPALVPWRRIRYLEPHQVLWVRWHDVDLGGVATIRVKDAVLPALQAHGVAVPVDVMG
jgi:hypothetical protein